MPWKPTTHRRTEANKRHAKTTTERGYGWEHQKQRERLLKERPLCQRCEAKGIVIPATDLHHKVKIKHRPDLARDDDNAEMLCDRCHTEATSKGE